MKKLDYIRAIATAARTWAEQYAAEHPNIGGTHTLACYCAIASAKLWHMLRNAGINAKLVSNDHHAFVVVDDWIVDITATQFGSEYEKVEIRHVDDVDSVDEWWWAQHYVHTCARQFRTHQRLVGWPRSQWVRLTSLKEQVRV